MFVQVIPSVEDCQFVTEPVFPDKVIVPEFAPLQTVSFNAVVPPTETGLTVIVTVPEFTAAQTPLLTFAR